MAYHPFINSTYFLIFKSLYILFYFMKTQLQWIVPAGLLICIASSLQIINVDAPVYTTFVVYYPDINLDSSQIYLRGDNCNLTWNKGVKLNHSATNQWNTVMLCPEETTISVKVLLNDSKWMIGSNTVFTGGQRLI